MISTSVGKVVKLIMVTPQNNNKFYDMTDNEDGTFGVHYGRVGQTGTNKTYPMDKWDSLYRAKVKKGYQDKTHLRAVTAAKVNFSSIGQTAVAKIVARLQAYANKSVATNYTISTEAVTQAMIDEAQSILDDIAGLLKKGVSSKKINNLLVELFQVIPRKMRNVNDFIIQVPKIVTATSMDEARRMVSYEQDVLDTMAGQVSVNAAQQTQTANDQTTILDAMGIDIVSPTAKDVTLIKKLLGSNKRQFKQAFGVTNRKTQTRFDKALAKADSKKRKLFWHGSRNENWWSILDTGLVLRPTNAIKTGSMIGTGSYFANKAQKSIGYSSLRGSYWTGGSSSTGFLSLFDVHLGNPLTVNTHRSWMYDLNWKNLRKRGDYDSVYFEGGIDLVNDEIVVYCENQTTVKFLVELTD